MKNTLLIIGFVWPEPKSSAAGSRMLQLIEAFKSDDYQITFASPCAKSDNAFNLQSIGVSQISIELNKASFDDFVKQLNPDVVLFDRFMMEEQFDTSYLFNDTAKREIASIYRSDLTLIISKAEMDILQHQFKVDPALLMYLPFMLDAISEEDYGILPKFENRNHFITIGNFLHEQKMLMR